MRGDTTLAAPLWLRAALQLTTRSMRAPSMGLAQPVPEGWRMRAASLRWFAVWQNHPEALSQLHAIILPEPWSDDARAWHALYEREIYALGLFDEEPDPGTHICAEGRLFERLAAPWAKLLSGKHS